MNNRLIQIIVQIDFYPNPCFTDNFDSDNVNFNAFHTTLNSLGLTIGPFCVNAVVKARPLLRRT